MWCTVLFVSMVTAGDILEVNDGTEISRDGRIGGGGGRIGGVYDTLGYAAPVLRLLSYLVGTIYSVYDCLSLFCQTLVLVQGLKFGI